MWIMAFSFYFEFINLAIASNILYSFVLYFTTIGVCYVWPNEVVQPFTCGLGICCSWIAKSTVSEYLPYIYEGLPLYWTPLIQSISGVFLFILTRPLFLESQGQSLATMTNRYSNYKYRLFSKG